MFLILLFFDLMEAEKDLEIDPITVMSIVGLVINAADFCIKHKDEIIGLVKKGWNNVQKIVNYIRNKYHY